MLFLLVAFIVDQASAQVDSTNVLLLNQGSRESINPNLDSGRYTVKSPVPKASKPEPEKAQPVAPNKPTVVEYAPNPVNVPEASLSEQTSPPSTPNDRTVIEALRESLVGGNDETISRYKDQLHPEDPRQNLLNISFAPSYVYVDSRSGYWFRDYTSAGPGLSLHADFWISPFLGIDVNYLTTLAADIDSDPTADKNVIVDHQMSDYGFVFRRYANQTRKAPWFELGLKYSEYKMIVPKNEQYRIRLKNHGVALTLDVNMPAATGTTWQLGTSLHPKIKTTEEKTGILVRSGTDPVSYAVEFRFGQSFSIDRQNQIFWEISHRQEKSIYEGTANEVDPRSSATPSGVNVNNSITVLKMGYTWGG